MREPSPNVPPFLDRLAAVSWRVLVIVVLVGGLIVMLSRLRFLVLALFLAFLVVSVLSPARSFLERRGVQHLLAVWIVMATSLLILAGVAAVIFIPFIVQAQELFQNILNGFEEIRIWLTQGPLGIPSDTVQGYMDQVRMFFEDNLEQVAGGVIGTTILGIEIAAALVLSLPIIFFLLKDSHRINEWLLNWVSAGQRERTRAVGARAWRSLSTFVQGTALIATVDAFFIGLGLYLMGVPLAGSLAVLTFVGAFIPIVGAFVAGIAAVLVALVAEGVVAALIILTIVVLVQQLEGNILAPMVVGRAVHLHPIVVILAITVGGTLGGILGAFFAVPLAAVTYAVASELRYPRPVAADGTPLAPPAEEDLPS